MESPAVDLKTEREKKNISLAQIAAETHISLHYLKSIEEGRYSDLPGGLYNRAFLKAYCESIHLDSREILERYDAQVSISNSEKKTNSNIPYYPRQNTFTISGPIIIWTIMLLISAIGIFFSRGWISEIFSPYFSKKTATVEPVQGPGEPSSDSISASTVSPAAPILESNDLKPSPDMPPTAVERTDSSQKIQLPPAMKTVSSESFADQKLRLEITAKEQCWIEVYIDGNRSIRKMLMEPGETEEFNATDRVRVKIGNAGGVQMKINDKPVKPLGNLGDVVTMNIDLESLLQLLDQPAG
jgi:cytoskeletal protein RodZ